MSYRIDSDKFLREKVRELNFPTRVDGKIETSEELDAVLAKIEFKNSNFADWKWEFRARTFSTGVMPRGREQLNREGFFVWCEFERPDTETGMRGVGKGREEIVWKGTSESGVVKTCWLLVELLARHELMEGFRYEGFRLFDPHNTVGDLMLPQILGTRR